MIQQMLLPFAQDAVSPAISAEAMRFHYDKHFAGYVTKASAAVEGTALAVVPLEAIIFAAQASSDMALFQNAGQVWNHAFFWKSLALTPTSPSEALATAIDRNFAGYAGFPSNLSTSARRTLARAGSGSSPMRAKNYRYWQHMTRPRLGWKPTKRRCWSAI